ncbi:hypothetical protein TrVFT333_010052 [Trichoderma virens FT-333]|nr:hypothetical protein TrVFT333_010052 [Trichoderma virens FT-333]
MGLAPATSDFPGPKASPEPSSTRLNPFDDSDVSSRKRRRTSASGSGSPSASVETGVYLSDSGSSPFYTTVNAMPVLDGAVQPSQESKQPRTPPQNVDSPTIPPDPLRREESLLILEIRRPGRLQHLLPPTPEEDKAKKSVEEAEPDVATNADADDGPQTPPTGWRASLSPPIEELFPGDHEMPDQADVELAANTFSPLDTGNVPPADPTMQFPYCDADTLPETVTRLHQFLSEQPPIEQEVSIYEQVRAWLDLYVQFAKARTPEDTFNSVYNNRVFWQSFLGLCGLITNKNLSPSAPPRLPILQRLAWKFSHSFVALTAQLVIVDFHTVRDWQAGAFQSSSESPSLISMDYLRQLHQLAQRSNYGPGSDPDSPNSASLGRSNLIAFFIEQLHDFTLEVIDSLCVFATGLIEIVQAFPRLVNILTPVIQSLTDCLNESCRPVRPGEPDEMTVKSNLIHVYHVWGDFSSLLLEIIEKHVGTLSSDGVSAQIQALAELLRRCLLYDGAYRSVVAGNYRDSGPRVAKAVAKMANSVANLLDYPTLMSLCEKLQALPTPDFNQATKALWDTIHQELLSRCRAEGITLGFLPYDLCLRLLREAFISSDDPQPPSMEAQSAAMDKFRALLQFGPDSQGRQELYSSCIKDIAAKSPTTLGSLCCLTMAIRPNIADEMDVLIQEHDLVRFRGMLLCVKKIVLAAVNNAEVDCDLDDETFLKGNGIEQLWRFVMGTSHASNAEDAIGSLAVGVYIKSQAITAYPFNRARRVQSAFVNRCLSQLKDSAMKIMASSDGASSGEDEPMVMVATEEEMLEQERIFTRALQLLRVFMEFHYTKPTLCAPDFRSIFHEAPCQVEGGLTALKYQSFDDGQATAIKPLHVGKLNTAAELISNLKFETGFDNYRAFYRGRQFLPLAKQVRASLESLHVEEGMILVKREENDLSGSTQIPSAASPLEIQVMSHFSELWSYLSLDDRIAKEVYSLLIKLPTGRHIINLFESPTTVYTDLFPPGQPYKFLYAIQAISKHIESVRLAESNSNKVGISYKEALRTSSSLVSQAISDESLLDQINPVLQVELMGALMHTFTQLLRNTRLLGESPSEDGVTYPDPGRLVNILADAANGVEGESSLPLIETTLSSILQLCLSRSAFMKDIVNLASFKKLLHRLILLDPRLAVRRLVVDMIKRAVRMEDDSANAFPEDARPPSVLMQYFWLVISDLLFEATGSPHQCQEFFDGIDYLFCKAAQAIPCELFMNGEFRRFILAFNIEDPNDSQQLLFHTQKLFGYLQDSYRRCIDPGQLVNSIKTYDDVLIDIHNQMDVEEFYSLFFDRLESQPMTDDEKKKLRSIYGGQLVQQVKSQECEHVSERLEPFSAIQCDIHGKVSLRESLDAYVRGEVLEGDNKYKCSSCDRHVNAVKRACLKEVPDNLIFHLKRFEFNLRTQQRNKVNDYFSFPPTIDMRPYTIDHLSNPTNTDQQDDMFELVGILIHAGTAESGHYYSYIRERTSTWDHPSWVEFNDDVVTPWDPRQMAASAFGGTAGQPTGLDSGGTGFDKTYSAYMLFYQRSSSLLAEQQALLSTQEVKTPLHVDTDITPLKEHILNDNTVLLKRHCLYDPSHVEFVQHCFRHAKLLEYEPSPSPDEEQSQDSGHGATATHPHALKTLAMEMALSHFDQLVTRIEGTPNFDSFAAMIQSAVVDCRDCAFSFFEYFNIRPEAFRALVQRNPDADVRAFTGTTMVTVLRKIATEMPQIYDRLSRIDDENELASNSSGHEESLLKPYVLEEVMVSFDRLWRFFQFHLRSWDEVFGMMLQFAQLGPREVAYLLSNDFLLKLLRIIAADASMELPPNYAKMLHTIYRRPANRPPSYESILKLISYLLSQLESTLGSQYIVDAPEDRLAFHEPPFPWTSDEVHLIHHHPDRQLSSIFVEKLLGIDQAREATHSILGRLTALSTQMDLRVFTTLRRKIQGDTTTEPLDPFLRGASVYLETTLSASHSQNLMRHIAAQAESLHSTEGMAFLEHFQASLNLKRKDGTMAQTTAASGLETLPDWVPHLLAFPDNELRYNTERFLDAVLFSSAPNISAEDTTMQDGREGTRDVIQRLGIACLLYLRDAHIRRRILIGRDTAVAMVRVVGKCADYFSLDAEDDDNGSDFRMLQDEVVGSLKRFVVDEDVEDDGSDWEGSCISSDPVDCQPDIGVQQIGEPDDANAI